MYTLALKKQMYTYNIYINILPPPQSRDPPDLITARYYLATYTAYANKTNIHSLVKNL